MRKTKKYSLYHVLLECLFIAYENDPALLQKTIEEVCINRDADFAETYAFVIQHLITYHRLAIDVMVRGQVIATIP